MSTPKYELHETDHGVDGRDAKTKLVARFTTKPIAEAWLAVRGYTFLESGSYYHQEHARRHTMGCISFSLVEAKEVPEDPA